MNHETFEYELNARMGRPYAMEYRLRESLDRQSWLIEQKVARALCIATPSTDAAGHQVWDDHAIRRRDGYSLVLETLKKPVFMCPSCRLHLDQPVPVMERGERRCRYCDARGERNIYFLGYWPLVDRLLDHLELGHPLKRLERTARDMVWDNRQKVISVDRKAGLMLESILEERHSSIVNIPRVYLNDTKGAASWLSS